MTRPEAEKYLQKVLDDLGEHFEAVQLLATKMAPEGAGTERYFMGTGNWYARQGMGMSFLKTDEARTLADEIGDKLQPPPPDDVETWKKP